MKKKLASALFLFACVIAFSPTDAHARPHKHHSLHRTHHHAHRVSHRLRRHGAHHARGRSVRAGGRPAAWCGWWLGRHLGISNRKLWLARNWAAVGRSAGGPRVGAVVVWRHHVGIITGQTGGKWIVKSGNDGHAVRERPRSVSGAIAFRSV